MCKGSAHYEAAARAFTALENRHDLASISRWLADDCDVHGFRGKTGVLEGLARFRRTYPRVWWRFPSGFASLVEDPRKVRFNFDRFWTDRESGRVMVASATEVISFVDQAAREKGNDSGDGAAPSGKFSSEAIVGGEPEGGVGLGSESGSHISQGVLVRHIAVVPGSSSPPREAAGNSYPEGAEPLDFENQIISS